MKKIKLTFIDYKVFIAAFFMGCFVAFGQAPWGLFPLSVIGLLGLFALTSFTQSNLIEKLVFSFGLGYFSLTLHWVIQPFLVETKYYSWLAPFAFLALVFICSSFWVLSTHFVVSFRHNFSPVDIALALTLGEFFRSYSLSGFPWALIGYFWIDTTLVQLAAWIGPLGLTGATLFILALPFSITNSTKILSAVITFFLILISVLVFHVSNFEQSSSSKFVRVIQPNAIQEKKWDPRYASQYFRKLLKLSTAQAERDLDLIVWPETAIVPWLNDASKELKEISENLQNGVELILGIRRYENNKIYNSLILLDEHGVIKAKYDKRHLVPFGEYIPIFKFLSDHYIIPGVYDGALGFSAGSGPKTLFSNIGILKPLICYEAIFFQEIVDGRRPSFLVNLTNDGWLGNWAGPEQHLQQTRMRAIEQGLPVIRSANTGISAIIDPYGNVLKSIPLGSEGYIDVNLPIGLDRTLYSKVGETIFIILIITWFLFIFRSGRANRY